MAGQIDEIAHVRTAIGLEQAYDKAANKSFIDRIPKML